MYNGMSESGLTCLLSNTKHTSNYNLFFFLLENKTTNLLDFGKQHPELTNPTTLYNKDKRVTFIFLQVSSLNEGFSGPWTILQHGYCGRALI